MSTTMHFWVGKLNRPSVSALTVEKGLVKRLFVFDKITGHKYLVDTGSAVSILPMVKNEKVQPANFLLYAANGTKIKTFGTKLITLDLGFKKNSSGHLSWQQFRNL